MLDFAFWQLSGRGLLGGGRRPRRVPLWPDGTDGLHPTAQGALSWTTCAGQAAAQPLWFARCPEDLEEHIGHPATSVGPGREH